MWDHAWDYRFRSIIKNVFFLKNHGFIIIYGDFNHYYFNENLDDARYWLKEVREYKEDIPMILVANKIDLKEGREIFDEEG
jgi:GTPase SAR1 family protein